MSLLVAAFLSPSYGVRAKKSVVLPETRKSLDYNSKMAYVTVEFGGSWGSACDCKGRGGFIKTAQPLR
jgi:hypothetical protein